MLRKEVGLWQPQTCVAEPNGAMMPEPSTRRGRDTKRRIIAVASELMYERGVDATSVEDVLTASGTGKSQFYHYLASKEELVAEVINYQLEQILTEQGIFLRTSAQDAFTVWESTLADGLHAMRAKGLLRDDADPVLLAEVTIAILQGGYLLSSTKQDSRPMRNALSAALMYLTSFALPVPA
jgi:AcrR family transcriptional regulator